MTEKKTPNQIVELLDKYIIGQNEAKKSVAVALYNRYRRLQLPKQMQQDITPKNMLMAGPTGVGKTEIARRLAKIVDAPFVKVEATKFTEVGYVGRDVESMVRDLVEEAVRMEEKDQFEHVKMQATKKANNRLVKLIVPGIKRENRENSMQQMMQMLSGNFNMNQPQDNEEVTDDILLALVYGGLLLGVGVGLVIKEGGCLDGTAAVAIMISKKANLSVGQIVFIFNIFIYGIMNYKSWHGLCNIGNETKKNIRRP